MMLLAGSIVLHQQSPGAIGVCLKMANCVFHLKWLLTAKPNLWLGCHYTATAGPPSIFSNTGGVGVNQSFRYPEVLWGVNLVEILIQEWMF